MAGSRSSPRVSARSSPRSSPKSARSTPKPKKSTPLKASVTPKKRGATGAAKTSPYFKKTATSLRDTKNGNDEEVSAGEDSGPPSPTGMTSSSSSSSSDPGESEDAFDPSESSGPEEEELLEESEDEMDSDFLDEEEEDRKGRSKAQKGTKRKSTGSNGTTAKKVKKVAVHSGGVDGYENEDEDEDDIELEEGQEIAGRIYPAPKTGQVPPGRISQNTLNFLKNLQIPERNDREWFRSHEPAFRQAENEWKAFVSQVQLKFHEADEEVPILPPKDVIHRIYRDVRFSSDKTPYKKSFSMSTSRGGRKGVWAAYHLAISPNSHSIIACGVWQPGKTELQTIRHHVLTEPERLREAISAPEFVELFGPPKPHAKGKRQNVFGHDDALKVAPKGVDKEHKDIDLLKLRSVAVVHQFSDEDVVAKDFQDRVLRVVRVMAPFVHLLNDFIALPAPEDE